MQSREANLQGFTGVVTRPGGSHQGSDWAFVMLPQEASDMLPSRGQVSVEGFLDGHPFLATLEPDGKGGHWFKLKPELLKRTCCKIGDAIRVEFAPAKVEPEPDVPDDLAIAIASAGDKAKETWLATTALARRDWMQWVVSGKKAETRVKRISVACDKLSKGNRRPCCFDRSGIYSGELSCPEVDPNQSP